MQQPLMINNELFVWLTHPIPFPCAPRMYVYSSKIVDACQAPTRGDRGCKGSDPLTTINPSKYPTQQTATTKRERKATPDVPLNVASLLLPCHNWLLRAGWTHSCRRSALHTRIASSSVLMAGLPFFVLVTRKFTNFSPVEIRLDRRTYVHATYIDAGQSQRTHERDKAGAYTQESSTACPPAEGR